MFVQEFGREIALLNLEVRTGKATFGMSGGGRGGWGGGRMCNAETESLLRDDRGSSYWYDLVF